MLKKNYLGKAYFEELYCDRCGAPMRFTDNITTTYPHEYEYKCTNCDEKIYFLESQIPGTLKIDFSEILEDDFEDESGAFNNTKCNTYYLVKEE